MRCDAMRLAFHSLAPSLCSSLRSLRESQIKYCTYCTSVVLYSQCARFNMTVWLYSTSRVWFFYSADDSSSLRIHLSAFTFTFHLLLYCIVAWRRRRRWSGRGARMELRISGRREEACRGPGVRRGAVARAADAPGWERPARRTSTILSPLCPLPYCISTCRCGWCYGYRFLPHTTDQRNRVQIAEWTTLPVLTLICRGSCSMTLISAMLLR